VRERGRTLSDRLFSSSAAVRQIVRALAPQKQPARKPLRVLMVNQGFWPDVAATAQHGHDLARYLVQRGDSVTALASRSIYGESGVTLPPEERVDGIRVVRVAHSAFGKRRIAGRVFDFVAFYAAAVLKALRLPKPDVVVCFTTPPFIAVVGLLLKWLRGSRFAFWAMDLYPEVPVAAGLLRRGSLLHRFFAAIDAFCMRHADVVVVLGRCMRERVLERGIDPCKVAMINVWSDPDEVRELDRERNPLRAEWNIGDRFVVEYSGNFGIGHDNATLFEAMRALSGQADLRWAIVGGGTKKAELESFVESHRIDNVVMRPYQPRGRLGELLALGDVHLVTMANEFAGLMVPSKFYGVLAAGRPLIFVGPRSSEVARVVLDEQCGIVVEPGDGAGLSAAVQALRQDPERARQMGMRGRRVLVERFDTQRACEAWHALLHRIVEVHA